MTKTFFTLTGLIGLALILMSNDTGVATEAGKDRTGSPFNATGGQQCNACHSGASFSTSITTRLKDTSGAIVTEYLGGATYTYEVEVTSSGATAYGFQAIALISGSNANAGTLSASSANSKIKVLVTTRRYAEHTAPSASGLFVMNWVAPAPGSGTVNFYAAGNGVNDDGLKTGDRASAPTTLTITESALSSVNEPKQNSISIYPNPVSEQLNITPNFTGEGRLFIASMEGKVVMVNNTQFEKGSNARVDVSALSSGTYFVSLIDEQGKQLVSTKFIKK
jgi:Secretion system C-terminal sorting domain